MLRHLVSNLLAFTGAIVGGALGFYIFGWLLRHGFYGLMIPGALLGGGCGVLAQHASNARGIVCGAAAAVFALFTEWWFGPFVADPSPAYFLAHLTSLSPVTWLMTVIGAFIAYWLARDAGIWRFSPAPGPGRPVSTKGPGEEV
ncbi:MAG: hypothetical protein ACLQIB_30890 [Isosphaeraceae bacterium]